MSLMQALFSSQHSATKQGNHAGAIVSTTIMGRRPKYQICKEPSSPVMPERECFEQPLLPAGLARADKKESQGQRQNQIYIYRIHVCNGRALIAALYTVLKLLV